MDGSKRYENSLIVILFFTWGTVFLGRMSQMYLAPYFAPEFRMMPAQIGTLASGMAISWAASTFLFGALSDRAGRKAVLIPAVFAYSILACLSATAHSFHQLLLLRALMGLAGGPTWSIMTALVEESSPPHRRGRNIGLIVSAAALVGLAAAPILATQVAARWGWRSAFVATGIPGFLAAAIIWKFVREPERFETHQHPTWLEYLSLLRQRNVLLCCLGATGFMCWLFALNVFAPLYITEVVHQPATTAGFLLGASGFGSFFLGFLMPSLSDRIGRKPVLLMTAAMSAVVPLALLVPSLFHYPLLLAAIVFATNTGQGMAGIIMVLVPTESVAPQFRAASIGLVTMVGEVAGATTSPLIAGALAEKYGLPFTMWLAAAGSGLVLLVAILLRETILKRGSVARSPAHDPLQFAPEAAGEKSSGSA